MGFTFDRPEGKTNLARGRACCCYSLTWAGSQVRFLCLALGRKFKVKSPWGVGHWIKNRKGAEKTYYFLSINIHP